jgi:acetyl esterase/lipase
MTCGTAVAQKVTIENDLVYGNVAGEELKLDSVKPTGKYATAPALVLIHGGGWQAGDKGEFVPFAVEAAMHGYVCITINYRHAPKHHFPAQVEDAKCAVRWLRSEADELNIDPQRIGAVGGSAGAHLAMMLGVLDEADGLEGDGGHADQSSKVQVVVSLAGPTNLLGEYPPLSREIVKKFIGGTKEERTDTYRQASPITYVNAGDAPMLLYQGTNDVLVPWDQATQMAAALTKAGVSGRVELLLGVNHGWGGKDLERTVSDALNFLDLHLKPK